MTNRQASQSMLPLSYRGRKVSSQAILSSPLWISDAGMIVITALLPGTGQE